MFLRSGPAAETGASEARRRPLDNPRVLVVLALFLLTVLAGLFWLADRSSQMPPTLLADVLLYALLAVNLALLLALLFVLARNLVKLWVEQRQARPFARFRGKLVAALLTMTIVPAVLVLISGSQIIHDSAERWFSAPVTDVLTAAQAIAREYYREGQDGATLRARRLARALPPALVAAGDVGALTPLIEEEPKTMRGGIVEVYRATGDTAAGADAAFLVGAATAPAGVGGAPSADRLAVRAMRPDVAGEARRADEWPVVEQSTDVDNGLLLQSAAPIINADNAVVGAVVVSQRLSPDMKAHAQEATAAYESYQGLHALQAPIQGVYLSVFIAVTLLILMSATWLGLYLAKRITRPVQMLAEGARAIGAGQLDFRLEPETGDELGALVESFNMMAAELRSSRERIEQSQHDLEQKNLEVDARRRYIETILERVATGVISFDAEGRLSTINGAAERLLGLDAHAIGRSPLEVFRREDLRALLPVVEAMSREPAGVVQEITLAREDREVHLAAAATTLVGDGRREGAVLVLDDVTPLIRAQRVAAWRDVARRLAHEIKNPLTPIQLSAERLRRYFRGSPAETHAIVDECTNAIIAEVEALKSLVDEFAQFARLRGPRMMPADLNRLVDDTLKLYGGVLQQGRLMLARQLAAHLPPVRFDAEQLRQVVINLVDNAVEALGGPFATLRPDGSAPLIIVRTTYDARDGVARLAVSDNGPGVPAADRDKLFMPYYSTKGRGSGLGLAIVRRIVAEHGGGIEVGEVHPTGSVFTIELPCQPS